MIGWMGCVNLLAQSPYFPEITFPVKEAGKTLSYPFAGGMNAPQFSQADLNADGIRDVVVFDRAGLAVQTWLGTPVPGDTGLVYAPQYAAVFPPVNSWMLLRDFDQDGAMDIFTAAANTTEEQPVRVYKGFYASGILHFVPISFQYTGCPNCNPAYLYHQEPGSSNWKVVEFSRAGIPVIEDIDSDGDMDLLAFEALSSNYLWLYENQSTQLGYGGDSLIFGLTNTCWGHFMDPVGSCKRILSGAPDTCATNGLMGWPDEEQKSQLHPYNFASLAMDVEQDGDMDLISGGDNESCLNLMINGGTPANAWMTAQDTLFPSNDIPANVLFFPAPFVLDTDVDGDQDLLVASAAFGITYDHHNVWHYRRTGGLFNWQENDFITGEMLDVGTGAHPAFLDVNNDGLLDLVVGNSGKLTNAPPLESRLVLYLNTGDTQHPLFELTDSDWLEFSQFAGLDNDFIPNGADIDGDGDTDIIVGSTYGILFFSENQSAQGAVGVFAPPVVNWQGIDVGSRSAPFFYDMDKDGIKDLLIGERNGNINYFKNTGTQEDPQFSETPDNEEFGTINTSLPGVPYGSNIPAVVDLKDGRTILITGSFSGLVEAYTVTPSVTASFPPLEPSWNLKQMGASTAPTLADIDNDGLLEMAIGNQSGGIRLYRTNLEVAVNVAVEEVSSEIVDITIRHLAKEHTVEIRSTSAIDWTIYSVGGMSMATSRQSSTSTLMSVEGWAPGIYILQGIQANGRVQCFRFCCLPD